MWEDQEAHLAGRLVLRPDFPGFGGRAPKEPTLDAFAESVIAEMDRAEVESAVIVGLSMGGYVAFRIVERWPERMRALVLADTRAGADSPEAAEKRTQQAERARSEGTDWLADAMIPAALGKTTRADRPDVVERVREIIDRADAEGVARALEALRDRPDSTSLLPRITVPVLAIVGAEDTITPEEEARKIAESVPNGRLVVIPGAGHLSNLENPAAFNEALEKFLQEI